MTKDSTKWYVSWFDTPYYHILYKDRDFSEAERFMKNLTTYLNLNKGDTILDLACGKGRHSIYLNKIGYHVTGADLSSNSIKHAQQFENERLIFIEHDMSKPFGKQFDAVFNLFTSFGYFDHEEDDINTIKAIKTGLTDNGCAVIDFMNVEQVIATLVPNEIKVVNTIAFHITREYKDGFIFKHIAFEDNKLNYSFTEKVKALTLTDFMGYFEKSGVHLFDIFGNYDLQKFEPKRSPRLILVFK